MGVHETAENNELKSVTDCFKCGPALSALPLAPENCLALFPRATHLIKHARAPPALRTLLILRSPFSVALIRPNTHTLLFVDCACTHIYTRVYSAHTPLTQIHVLHGSILFSFPFPLLFSLGHASTPFHRSFSLSFEFLHRIGNQSLYLPFFLCSPLVVCLCLSLSFLFLVLGGCFLPCLSSLISLSTCTQARPKPLLPPSVARCRSFQLLQRQPNKCLSYSLPRRFAPLSLHSANSARVHGKTS